MNDEWGRGGDFGGDELCDHWKWGTGVKVSHSRCSAAELGVTLWIVFVGTDEMCRSALSLPVSLLIYNALLLITDLCGI